MDYLAKYKAFIAPVVVVVVLISYFTWSYLTATKQVTPIILADALETAVTESTASAKNIIYVDIAGAVVRPGLYILDSNSRVSDLLKLAGGVSKLADVSFISQSLNLSQKLKDSQKLYIPFNFDRQLEFQEINLNLVCSQQAAQASVGDPAETNYDKVNVNTASKAQLVDLPGIGEVTAGKIIAERPYKDIENFYTRFKLSAAVKEKLLPILVAD